MKRASLELRVVALLCVSSCSLMGLDEIEPVRCNEDSDCEPAGRAFPDPNGCHTYVCRDELCVLPSSVESCNGEDDDCNGWIDDGLELVSAQRVAEPALLLSRLAAASNASATYVVTAGDDARGWILSPDSAGEALEPAAALRYRSSSQSPEKPCMGEAGPMDCDFSQVAIAVDREHAVYAAISTRGCAKGLLRIGLARLDDDPFSIQLGKAAGAVTQDPNNIEFGVDVFGSCTGTDGASNPAVALSESNPGSANALVTWLYSPANTGSANEGDCERSAPSAVGALGVFVPEGEADFLNGTDGGIPVSLGESLSRAQPAVLALNAASPAYLVAFASIQDGVEGVRFSRVDSVSEQLDVSPLWFQPAPGADRVVLTLGRTSEQAAEVGIVWSSGCDTNQVLKFATLFYPRRGTPELSERWTLAVPGLVGSPRVLFAPEGFATKPRPSGGWSILWLESSPGGRDLKLARIAEARLSEPESSPPKPVTLRPGPFGSPIVYPSDKGELRYALVQLDTEGGAKLETIGGWCDVRD